MRTLGGDHVAAGRIQADGVEVAQVVEGGLLHAHPDPNEAPLMLALLRLSSALLYWNRQAASPYSPTNMR